jgi:hypothetical protein
MALPPAARLLKATVVANVVAVDLTADSLVGLQAPWLLRLAEDLAGFEFYLDLQGVPSLSPEGLAVLALHEKVRANGSGLTLFNARPRVYAACAAAGLSSCWTCGLLRRAGCSSGRVPAAYAEKDTDGRVGRKPRPQGPLRGYTVGAAPCGRRSPNVPDAVISEFAPVMRMPREVALDPARPEA